MDKIDRVIHYLGLGAGFSIMTIIFLALFAIGPYALIWGLNLLFDMSITYTANHWLGSALILLSIRWFTR